MHSIRQRIVVHICVSYNAIFAPIGTVSADLLVQSSSLLVQSVQSLSQRDRVATSPGHICCRSQCQSDRVASSQRHVSSRSRCHHLRGSWPHIDNHKSLGAQSETVPAQKGDTTASGRCSGATGITSVRPIAPPHDCQITPLRHWFQQ